MECCTNCGKQVEPGVKFCTSCGFPAEGATSNPLSQSTQTVQQPVPVQPNPAYVTQPSATYQEEPISTGSYIGIMFLLMIPLLNIIFIVIWACGLCRKQNLRNLARATLVWMLISILLGGLTSLVAGILFSSELNELNNAIRELESQINNKP